MLITQTSVTKFQMSHIIQSSADAQGLKQEVCACVCYDVNRRVSQPALCSHGMLGYARVTAQYPLLPSILKSLTGCTTSNCTRRAGSTRRRRHCEKVQNVPRKSDRNICRNGTRLPAAVRKKLRPLGSDSSGLAVKLFSLGRLFDLGSPFSLPS